MVCIVCSTPKSPDKSRFKLHTMAKNGVQDSVHGVQGSVQGRRNAQIGLISQAHAASLLYVHPHPTAARRAATLASSEREMHMGARTSSDRFRGVSWQRKRKGDAIRRPPTYTQAQTHSCKRRVRRFLFWWRRGESNSCLSKVPRDSVYSFFHLVIQKFRMETKILLG
jgi:hypothetical protein